MGDRSVEAALDLHVNRLRRRRSIADTGGVQSASVLTATRISAQYAFPVYGGLSPAAERIFSGMEVAPMQVTFNASKRRRGEPLSTGSKELARGHQETAAGEVTGRDRQ